MSKVLLEKIKKSYDKNEIIKGVDLEIQDKEFLVLVGPSGCGKSTLLRIIAGLEDVSEGKVFIGEKDVTNVHPKDRDIAMVFQNYALYPHMSVYENMAFALKMRKIPKNEIDEKVKEAAQILDLTDYLDRKPSQLSGGQRQRVALGRAIVRNPKVFLMDEPLSNLDAKLRSSTRFEIKKLHKKLDTTFVYVTHDQVEAMTMGDRIAVLHKGKLQQLGNASEIYKNPKNIFVAGFIGSPSMNFIEGEIKDNRFISSEINIEANYPDQTAVLGIRSEDLILDTNGQIKSQAELVEMLGSEKLVHFNFNDSKIIAKLPSDNEIKQGDTVAFSLNLEKINLFNKAHSEKLNSIVNAGIESQKEDFKNEVESYKDKEAKKIELTQMSLDAIGEIGNLLFDGKSQQLNQELSDLENYYTTDIEEAKKNKNLKLISEEEFAKRQTEIKIKQAKLDKEQALFNIALSTAQAVIAALAMVPPNIPLSIFAGVTGAAQAIAVASKPLPKYAKGKKAGGTGHFATVGELGAETMWIPDNAAVIPHNRKMNFDTFQDFGIPTEMDSKWIRGADIDYDKLGASVGKHVKIPKQKAVTVNVDKNGITVNESDISRTTFLNKKYKGSW